MALKMQACVIFTGNGCLEILITFVFFHIYFHFTDICHHKKYKSCFSIFRLIRLVILREYTLGSYLVRNIAHLPQHCHNSKFVIFQEKFLKVLKCYNFLWVQRRHNCSPAACFANCFMALYLLKVHLQTFLSIPITQKCQILSCDTLVANVLYITLSKLQCTSQSKLQYFLMQFAIMYVIYKIYIELKK